MDYRSKDDFVLVTFPTGFTEEDRGLKGGCCQNFFVFGSTTDNISYKNDIELVPIKRSTITDIVTFSIEKCGIEGDLDNLGVVCIFNQDDLAVGFMFDWQQYLDVYEAGRYTIKVSFTISGVVGGFDWGIFDLSEYSIKRAVNTIRMKSTFDSFSESENIDFSNSNCTGTLRLKGYFGDPQDNTETVQLITKGGVNQKVKTENLTVFELKTDPLIRMFTRRLQFHLLNQDDVFMSDHNKTNHFYDLFDEAVVLSEGAEVTYRPGSRLADVNVKLGIRTLNQKSFYNRQ